jgi:anaerobic ribonucleoside-triphosphate reductase activating protein
MDVIEQMLSNPLTDGLTLSGGEPFAQPHSCIVLARSAHKHGINVWAYSGWTFEHLRDHGTEAQKALLQHVDVLVDGPYIEAERTLSLPWRGSKNQRLIDVQASLKAGKVIEWQAERRADNG